jgi:putative ABC transport system permease protein
MRAIVDWRLAVRMVFRQPGLAAAAVIALALGVGLTTLLFSIGYGIFLRGLPLPDGRRIMAVTFTNVATGGQKLGVSIHDFADWRAAQRSFDDLAAFQYASLNVVVRDGQPERLRGAFLTANGLRLLNARPLLGRTLVPADGGPGAAPVLVLGYGAWTTYFGSDPRVIGRAVRADGEPATIVGVMPRDFGFPQSQEAWMVLRADPLQVPRGKGPSLIVYGRLKAGTSVARAQADLGTIAAGVAREHPETNRNLTPVVLPYTQAMSGNQDSLIFMWLTVGLGFGVLLVGCANVANLLFARAASRTREIAIRTALGAGRRHLVAQLLAETAVLAMAGTAVGLLLVYAGIWQFNQAIVDTAPPFWVKVELDPTALAFAAGLTIMSAVLSGAIPAWRASRADVDQLLRDGATSGNLRLGRMSRVLVTGEIVVSFALLVAAGLMTRSIVNLGTHEYGFAMEDVFTARLVLPESRYGDVGSRARFAAALQERIAALPTVRSATLASDFPGLSADRTAVAIGGQPYEDTSRYPVVRRVAIAPRFFETFGRQLIAGRDFTSADDVGAPLVAIVNASFAGQLMAGVDPVGRRIRLGRGTEAPWLTIVGVAPDLHMAGAENRDPAGLYVPLAQSEPRAIGLAARVSGAPLSLAAQVRAQARAMDRDLPVYSPNSLGRAVDDSLWPYRVFGPLLVLAGVAALFLATIGLYSLMAFAMRQRMREIGLRMALGAQPGHVARLVAGQVSAEIAIGLLVGAGLATVLSRAMRAMLFHVQPGDPLTYVAIVAALVLAASLAAWVPVRRAIRVDPSVTLRDA